MASRSLGQLTLDLVAKIGGFVAGLSQAEREAEKKSKAIRAKAREIEKEWSAVGKGIAAGFAGITIGSLFGKFIEESKNAQNEQAQLAAVLRSTGQAAGYSAEQLNLMAEKMAQSSIFDDGDINRAQTRLLSYTNVVGEQFPMALQAAIDMASRLGMDIEQSAETIGKALDVPAQGLTALSKQGFKFSEDQKKLIERLQDTGRTAEAQQIILDALGTAYGGAAEAARNTFGGAIAGLQNQLNSLMTGEDGSLQGATDAINDLAKTMGSSEVRSAFNSMVSGLASIINLLASATSHFVNFGRFVGEAMGKMVAGSADPIDRIDEKLVGLREELAAVDKEMNRPRRFGAGNGYASLDELRDRAAGLRREIEGAEKARADFARAANAPASPAAAGVLPRPGRIPTRTTGGGGAQDDPTKKLLENELKAYDRMANAAKGLLADRNRFLDLYNGQGLISIENYYSAQQAILDEATRSQVDAYQKQIEALRKYQAQAKKPSEQADAEGKINALLEKQAELQREAGLSAIEMGIKRDQATKEYRDALQEVNTQLEEMRGNLGAAAALQFDQSNERRRQLFTANGNAEALKALDTLKQYQVAQANLNKLQQQFALVQGDLQIAEERITIARERGTIGELESLQKSGEARRAQYAILQQQIAAFDKLKVSMQLTPEQLQQYERLKLQLEQLGTSLDPLADKFDTTLKSSFENAFGDFINGTKTAKQAFASFANSIASEIQKMAIQDLSKQIFKGGTGGAGSWLSSLFGSSGGGGGFDFGKLFGSFFGGSTGGNFGFATGGYTGSGGMFQPAGIVHRGEYVLDAATTRRLGVPALDNLRAGGGMGGGATINVNVLPGATRETGYQAARDMGRELQRSGRR